MLVCNVSLRAPRRAIAAELAEATTAADATATGNIVFATLVDDPASVGGYRRRLPRRTAGRGGERGMPSPTPGWSTLPQSMNR